MLSKITGSCKKIDTMADLVNQKMQSKEYKMQVIDIEKVTFLSRNDGEEKLFKEKKYNKNKMKSVKKWCLCC